MHQSLDMSTDSDVLTLSVLKAELSRFRASLMSDFQKIIIDEIDELSSKLKKQQDEIDLLKKHVLRIRD